MTRFNRMGQTPYTDFRTFPTNHLFNLEKPLEYGAFLNLAQHHGFPTPLLDWTHSPFVAAWFAYSSNSKEFHSDKVRIFSLDRRELLQFEQFQSLTFVRPHFSILEAISIENNRAIPQQGILTLTNVHDIENHIRNLEKKRGNRLISAFDLPVSDKEDALNDLAMMGITRSTLFPGIESVCGDLRERLF